MKKMTLIPSGENEEKKETNNDIELKETLKQTSIEKGQEETYEEWEICMFHGLFNDPW